MDLIKAFTSEQLKTEVPQFKVGDTVRVYNRIKEGTRERIQLFELCRLKGSYLFLTESRGAR